MNYRSNPFPGLRPFAENEENLFFGREIQVDTMVDKLAASRFLAVVGPSGSGKSSLVNCGLQPALRRGLLTSAGTSWKIAKFRPGNSPIQAMAKALAGDGFLLKDFGGGFSLEDVIDTHLRVSKRGLLELVKRARLPEQANLLVIVDQFEELFRYSPLAVTGNDVARSEAIAFVNLLLEPSIQRELPIYVVITMRSDFLGDCAQFPGLPDAINNGQYLVPRMSRDQRRRAIRGPIGVGQAEISPVLLTRLVNDVGDNPDQLSILQHALNRTWARWQYGNGSGPLDLKHYEDIGAMAHALDQHAEKAYAELDTARRQQICEKLFKALTDKATDPRGVRRPTKLGTLCALADATTEEVTAVIDVFRQPSRSFLMPPAGEVLEEKTVIDISHESLMRVWERLKVWADEEAESVGVYRRLAETATRQEQGLAYLWRGPDLRLGLEWQQQNEPNETWAAQHHPRFGSAIRFLEDSSRAEKHERFKKIGLIVAILVVAFSALIFFAVFQRENAIRQAGFAEQAFRAAASERRAKQDARGLAAASLGQQPGREIEALVVAVQATGASLRRRESISLQAVEGLNMAVSAVKKSLPLRGHTKTVTSAAFSPDGSRVLTGSDDDTVRLWNTRTGRLISTVSSELVSFLDTWFVTGEAFSPDGTRVIIPTDRNTVILLNTQSGEQIQTFQNKNESAEIYAAAFLSDGTPFYTTSMSQHVKRWNAETGALLLELKQPGFAFAVLSPDGTRVATGGQQQTLHIWNAENGKLVNGDYVDWYRDRGWFLSAAFSSDGTRLVATANYNHGLLLDTGTGKMLGNFSSSPFVTAAVFQPDGAHVVGIDRRTPLLINAQTGEQLEPLSDSHGAHSGGINHAVFSPDGRLIVTASQDHTARLWDMDKKAALRTLRGHASMVRFAVFSPSGQSVVSTSADQTARVWDTRSDLVIPRLKLEKDKDENPIRFVDSSPDGTRVVTLDRSDQLVLWDAKSGSQIFTFEGVSINSVTFSTDGTRILAIGGDVLTKVVYLLDGQTGIRLFTAESDVAFHQSGVNSDNTHTTEVGAIIQELHRIACSVLRHQPEFERVRDDCSHSSDSHGSRAWE